MSAPTRPTQPKVLDVYHRLGKTRVGDYLTQTHFLNQLDETGCSWDELNAALGALVAEGDLKALKRPKNAWALTEAGVKKLTKDAEYRDGDRHASNDEGGWLAAVAGAASTIRGPFPLAALALLLLAGLASYQFSTPVSFFITGLALPLLVFALLPWELLIRELPIAATVVVILLALMPFASIAAGLYLPVRGRSAESRERETGWPPQWSDVKSAEVQASEVDDRMILRVNGNEVFDVKYGETPAWVSIKNDLRRGPNSLEVVIINGKNGGCGGSLALRLNGRLNPYEPEGKWRWSVPMKDASIDAVCAQQVKTVDLE